MAPCGSSMYFSCRFGGTYCIHLQCDNTLSVPSSHRGCSSRRASSAQHVCLRRPCRAFRDVADRQYATLRGKEFITHTSDSLRDGGQLDLVRGAGVRSCQEGGNKELEEGVVEALVVGSSRAMCDSSIRNKKLCSSTSASFRLAPVSEQ
jgi:hypothetical protein